MALPPTIPTSFVPRQPVSATAHKRTSGANPFLMLSYIILGITLIASAAVYGYKYYLDQVATTKSAALTAAQNNVDQATLSQFIRLRDRFTSSKDILNKHVELSQFFDVLESITLQGVRFNSLDIAVNEDRTAQVTMSGTAKTFNALAAQSAAFAAEKRIKRAIFSSIDVNPKDGTVAFELKADLDPTLVEASTALAPAPVIVPVVPVATTTPPAATTTPAASTTKP